MKTAVIILTCNAEKDNPWLEVLQSYEKQDIHTDLRMIFDSSSTDRTCELAGEFHWQIRKIARKDFNHGNVRNMLVNELAEQGFDLVIFATQDAILTSANTLSTLVENLKSTSAAAAYARQIPRDINTFDGYFRTVNYPAVSRIKEKQDIPALGLRTPFCSNTLAVWDIRKNLAAGGFPPGFGEDMLLAAKLLLQGEKISYCAEAVCLHSHKDTLCALWARGCAIGEMHHDNPWLLQKFGRAEKQIRKIRLSLLPYMVIKYAGYLYGKFKLKREKK